MPQGSNLLKPVSLRVMTEVEAAWVGAMIEAEGSIYLHPQYNQQRMRIDVCNTDPEIISALLRLTGIGSVYVDMPRDTRLGTKPAYHWLVHQYLNAGALARRIAAYSPKAQRLLDTPIKVVVSEVTAGKRWHVKCCDDIIQSTDRHDMVWCKCGKSAIDGGNEYTRVTGDWSNFEEVTD
jgi:hypothetical protein